VVAPGGSNTGAITCTPAPPPADPTSGCTLPQVISTYPTNTATDIDISTFPVITFNEPVTNVPANVQLKDASGGIVPITLVGLRAPNPNNPNQNPVANPLQATDVITSLTIEPNNGLNYNTTYSIFLNTNAPNACLNSNGNPAPQPTTSPFILDLNQAPNGPFCLQPFPLPGQQYQFTTFAPSSLGNGNSQFSVLTRPVVIGPIAYEGEYLSTSISGLGMFNVSNPIAPVDLGIGGSFVGRAIDIAGQSKSPVTASGGGLVAISAGTAVDNLIPGNVWLYDVASPTQPTRVGAVSVTNKTSTGIALRLSMKDQYLYTSTFLQGLQVVDLGLALNEYAQVFNSNPEGFGQAVTTAGTGFAADAVVNTIPLHTLPPIGQTVGGTATMFDLKATDFAATGGGANTLIVATGQLPLVMADPFLSASSAVIYPPNIGGSFQINPVAPLLMTSSDGLTNSLLCFGQALDIGEIPITNDNGTTSDEHVVVVVGNGVSGPATSTTSCPTTGQVPVLAVVNVSALYYPGLPYTPQLVGFLNLPKSGTDVVLNGSTAMVSTGGNILLVDVQNPTQPTLSGQISGNFGNWLALSPTGFPITTTSGGTGVQTATTGPTVLANCPSSILSTVVSGAGTQNPVYKTAEAVSCPIYTNVPVASVSVTLTPTNLTAPLVATSVNGTLQITIPSGTQVNGALMYTQATGISKATGAPIVGPSVQVNVGPVHIVVDSDNDTIIDPVKDPAAATAGKAFNFWIADPNGPTINGGQDALLDYASLRVYVNVAPDPNVGTIQLTLSSATTANMADWVLTRNVGVVDGSTDAYAAANEKLYLTDQNGINAKSSQGGSTPLKQITVTGTTLNPPTFTCDASGTNTFESQLCRAVNGTISLTNIQSGKMYDLLFAINDTCFKTAPTTCLQDTSWTLKVQLLIKGQSQPITLDQVPLDIRKLQQRIAVYTMRSGALQPLSSPVLLPVVPPAIPWTDIPASATKLNVLVHGYLVTQDAATVTQPNAEAFIPSYFKRLYWTGLPVMMAQGNVQSVGIVWYGDVTKFNWPDDEFSALSNGPPLANFIATQAAAGRKMTFLAHSLGNMVVNSAIDRLITNNQTQALSAITSYVMNEAAVPSEAFDIGTASGLSPLLSDNANTNDGYSTDSVWHDQWNNLTDAQDQLWSNTLGASNYITVPQPVYYLRWQQQRPSTGVPDSAGSSSTPQRGSWLGYFSNNPKRVTITNTVNANDDVLGEVWWLAQYCEKPNLIIGKGLYSSVNSCYSVINLTTGQIDDANHQFWAALRNTDPGQEATWGAYCTTPGTCAHANITRQFAELSYWFPSISNAEGAGGLPYNHDNPPPPPVTNTVTTFDFSPYSPKSGTAPPSTQTHSYMGEQPYSIVSPAWKQIKKSLCPTCN